MGFSSKHSPVYGGLESIGSGGGSCGTVMNFVGSSTKLFSIDLWEMLGVFGYTTAMATEQYPKV